MNYSQDTKKVALDPASFTTGAAATLQVDRLGFDYVSIDALLGHMTAGGASPSVLNLSESDVTNATSFVAITGTSHTANVTTLPTTGCTIATWDVNCTARKRYIQANVTAGSTGVVGILGTLSRAKQSPAVAADKGVTSWIVI